MNKTNATYTKTEITKLIEEKDRYCNGCIADLMEIPEARRAQVIENEQWAKDRMESLEANYATLERLRGMLAAA